MGTAKWKRRASRAWSKEDIKNLLGFAKERLSGTEAAKKLRRTRGAVAYTDCYPFRLARFGAAIFGDVGRTWGRGVAGNSDPGTLSDLGCGMRFGNTRSGLGSVLHIDVAFPLNGDRNIGKVQFLVQTKASY